MRPLAGSFCSVCGEALLSPAFLDRAEPQCGLCQRTNPPFEKAVAYGSYDGGLRDLIHLLKYQQVRPAAALKQLARPERFQMSTDALARRRETGSQIGLTRHQRRENLRGAFSVADPERVAERNILLVDDVFTTGTTASECARILRRAGAARVWVATVGRTLKASDVFAVPEQDLGEGSEERLAAAAG